jgi:hypothetical protein
MTRRIPGQMKDGMDKRKFDGKTYYAWGEYRLGAVGKGFAERAAEKMRALGHKARIVKHVTGYQVYCDSELGVMGQ